MKRLISSLIFLITTHTMCFSLKTSDADTTELDSRKKLMSEKYQECKKRKELPEYTSNASFYKETEKLELEAEEGMMDLAKAGYVEARIWRGKRELQLLEFHRDLILSSLQAEEEHLVEKSNGILLKKISKLRRDLQDICEHLNDSEHNLKYLKKLKKQNVKIVHDTQYYNDNHICLLSLCDKDEGKQQIKRKSLAPSLQIVPTPAPVTCDYVNIFKKSTRKTLDDLSVLESELRKLDTSKALEALDIIKRIQSHINQNDYLSSKDDQSDIFVDFIFSIIRESTDYAYAIKPSFRAVGRVRDVLFSALIRLSDENVTSVDILMSLTDCLLSPSNKRNIQDKIDCWKAELQLVGEIKRYLSALNDPDEYAKLAYKKLYESKNREKIIEYYTNDTDYDSCVYVDSLLEPAARRFLTLQTFFINESYNPYKNIMGSTIVDFMDFGRKNFRISLADINKYIRNKDRSDCPYYVYAQSSQTILISKNGPYNIRYHHGENKLTIGYLQTYPYDARNKRWIGQAPNFLVCDGENEIIKYARYDAFDLVEPANRIHLSGFSNAKLYNEQETVLGFGHFQIK